MEASETQQHLLQHVRQLAAEVAELKREGAAPLTDDLAQWIAAQFVVAARAAARNAADGCVDLKTLRGLCADVVALQRGDHGAARLKLERERLDLHLQEARERSEAFCIEWARDPENHGKIAGNTLTKEEQAKRIREIFRMSEPKAGISKEAIEEMERALKLL